MIQDLWRVMQADHDMVWDLLNQLTGGAGSPSGSPKEHRRLARELVAIESAHEAAEELVIWPVVRRVCPDGEDLVFHATGQERQAKRALNELSAIKAGNKDFEECVATVASHARQHITYEQNQIWPRLADHLTAEEADRLGRRWVDARLRGPTRPHPHTPPMPGALASAGYLLARLDRLRDALTGRKVPTPAALSTRPPAPPATDPERGAAPETVAVAPRAEESTVIGS
ncbi:MAG TPA: hemerythrin domain-containing protein [Acidimicrobiales bacterium]|nr:hemerythrin domain-containing protein [Acidimicrobiales bacterium]